MAAGRGRQGGIDALTKNNNISSSVLLDFCFFTCYPGTYYSSTIKCMYHKMKGKKKNVKSFCVLYLMMMYDE